MVRKHAAALMRVGPVRIGVRICINAWRAAGGRHAHRVSHSCLVAAAVNQHCLVATGVGSLRVAFLPELPRLQQCLRKIAEAAVCTWHVAVGHAGVAGARIVVLGLAMMVAMMVAMAVAMMVAMAVAMMVVMAYCHQQQDVDAEADCCKDEHEAALNGLRRDEPLNCLYHERQR
jgi:hypothetical protein